MERIIDQWWQDLLRTTSRRDFQALPREERSRIIRERFDQPLDWLASLSRDARALYLNELTPGECSFLRSIATGGAESAVNRRSEDELARGVLAASFLVGAEDFREIVRELTLLANSARRLGTDLREILPRIKDDTTREGANFVEEFAGSGPIDLPAYGYAECWNPEIGFYYGSLWGSRARRARLEGDRLRPGQPIPSPEESNSPWTMRLRMMMRLFLKSV